MKRKAAITAINALYKAIDTCCNTVAKVFAIDLSGWEKVIERVAQDMQEGKLHPDDLDTEMLHKTYNDLNDGLRAGYGKEFLKINKDTGAPDPSALKLQQNIYKFSGAKTFAQLQELNSKLVINGRRATWDEFKKEALKINANYNINHLQAEHETANQSAQHAVNWQQYERNKKQYPNLKYMTQQDDRVRPEHQALQGIVAPVGSDFWNKYYPPNGWRCRCYVVQTSEKATHDVPDDVPSVPKEFRMNVGKSGQVFNEEDTKDAKAHPYFALAKDVGGKALEQVFERSKLTAPYNQVYTAKSGGTVHVSPFADTTDFADNFKTATIIADDLGFEVRLRPHLDRHIILTLYPRNETGVCKPLFPKAAFKMRQCHV